jgi:hypothetical protein
LIIAQHLRGDKTHGHDEFRYNKNPLEHTCACTRGFDFNSS